MSRNNIAIILAYAAGITALIGTIGQFTGSVPAMQEYFGAFSPEAYWANRLDASLYLGSIGLLFGSLITIIGAYLFASKDIGRQFAGSLILLLSTLPHIASIISLFILTPSDWTHTITHIIAVFLVLIAVSLRRQIKIA